MSALPGETEQQLAGLQAQAQQSHQDILDASRRRGLGFSGIPVGEQVKYDATTFKPAVANLYSAQNQRKTSLDEALNALFRDQRNQATGIFQQEQDREEARRQFEANLAFQREQAAQQAALQREALAAEKAARGGGGGGYLGGGAAAAAAPQPSSSAPQGFRAVLSDAASKGSQEAKLALSYVGNDGKYWIDFKNPPNRAIDWNRVKKALDAVGAKNAWRG